MIDLGDLYQIPFYTYNDAGVLTDATTFTVTLTLPDLTVATLTVGSGLTHTGTGIYTPSYATTQAGQHLVRAVAAGAVVGAYVNVFYVESQVPGLLISLEEARAALTKNAADTAKDDDLRYYIEAATPIMEDLVGAVLQKTVTETFDGGSPTVALSVFPAVSITSVTEYQGLAAYTVSNEPLGGAQDGFGFTWDSSTNVITRRSTGAGAVNFPKGAKNVVVVYVAGRTLIPGNVRLATRALVAHLWQHDQQGFRPGLGGTPPPAAMAYTPSGYAVPKYVVELVANLRRPSGMY